MGDVVIFPGVQYRRIEMPDLPARAPQPQWRWFALKVAPGREFAAERILRDDGFDVFVPLKHVEGKPKYVSSRNHTGRLDRQKRLTANARPLLAGYVFIGFDRFDIPWLDVHRFRMIIGVIADGNEPYAFPEHVVRWLVLNTSRPVKVQYFNEKLGRKKKRKRPNAEVTSGPYQGQRVRMVKINDEVELYDLVDLHLAHRPNS